MCPPHYSLIHQAFTARDTAKLFMAKLVSISIHPASTWEETAFCIGNLHHQDLAYVSELCHQTDSIPPQRFGPHWGYQFWWPKHSPLSTMEYITHHRTAFPVNLKHAHVHSSPMASCEQEPLQVKDPGDRSPVSIASSHLPCFSRDSTTCANNVHPPWAMCSDP